MRAAVITRFGDPDVLEVKDVPPPRPSAGEVLVRVRTSALNRADLLQRVGRYPPPADSPRDIPGIEFAGEVAELGAGVAQWSIGDRVFGIAGGGAHAEFLVAHPDTLVAVPASLGWTDAGAVPEAFMTAHDAMVVQAGLRDGETVLIHAVASGVGLAAVQVAKAIGAKPYGTTRTAAKLERAREHGLVDGAVVTDDFAALTQRVPEWTGGKGFDVVIDLAGGPYVAASVEALATKGRLMLVGAVAGAHATLDVRRVLGKRLTMRGTVLRARSLEEKVAVARAFARDVLPLLENGGVRPTVDRVFPLSRIAEAHRLLESNATVGKVVLEIDG